ncbi:MAG TPA: M1 family metallopeptidase [Pseudoduganella sp.]
MQRKLISAVVLSLFLSSAAIAGTTTQLPQHTRPTHYSIALKPDAANAAFSGRVKITMQVAKPTRSLTLNAVDLAITSAEIGAAKGKQAASAIKPDNEHQTVTLEFARPLSAGKHELTIDYSGKINSQASGLFYLDYDSAGDKKRALYTQFEAADARRMFPSWDEPAFRTTFSVEATVPAAQMAVSNMPIADSKDLGDGTKLVRFATTPRMSTYLLFFGMGDFERATRQSGKTELGVVTVRGRLPQAQFVLDSSDAVLREYNDYFGAPYPLPKLDNVAAPGRSNFFGAMENWGAIMSFETFLLLDPAVATQSDRQNAFSIAAHETAHQWFGDLVTMRWWDDLWLNESFASWMAARTTARLHPEWQTSLDKVAARNAAMERDALSTTHPIVQHVATVEEAHSAFDEITYEKGESVIGMLENYVGEDAWRNGVRSYIKANAYGNAESHQLWKHIEKAAHQPVTAIAHDFTLQPGVPLLRVESQACEGGQTRVTLTQSEYSKDKRDKRALTWRVPVLAQTVGSKAPVRVLVNNGKASLTLPGCGPVLANAGQAGYYRVLYAPAAYGALASSFATLDPIDQLGFMTDTWALGISGYQPASDFLALVKAAQPDAPSQVWLKAAEVLETLKYYARDDAARSKAVSTFAIARLSPVMQHVGWDAAEGEPAPRAILREQLIRVLGSQGDPAVVAEARRRYQASLAGDAKALPPELRRVVLHVVAQHADAATWDQLHDAARAEQSSIVKNDLYMLLGAAADPMLARRALELALSGEPAATTASGIIGAVAGNHSELAFDFALANMDKVNGLVDVPSRAGYYSRLASGSTRADTIAKLQAFADANLAASARGPVATAVSRIQFRIDAIRDRMPAVESWLAQNAEVRRADASAAGTKAGGM